MNPDYLEFLYNLGLFNIKLGLSTIGEMLNRMGNPHHHPRIIHIAGTNGKGSTLATLERLLIDSGFSTGSTISPHLISYNERFRINGRPVDNDRLNAAFERVCRSCNIDLSLKSGTSRDGAIKPTFFEFSIAIAFELFRMTKVSYILLETGMGGRLDATNIVKNPLACVITRIAMDHQEFLGETIEQIAYEKLGILKKGSPVFVADQDPIISTQIKKFCEEKGIECLQSSKSFRYKTLENGFTEYRLVGLLRNRSTDKISIEIDSLKLRGEHQKENTATALAVYYSIVPQSKCLSPNAAIKSLKNVYWEGRLDFIDQQKKILVDGAHNLSSFNSLLDYLKSEHAEDRILVAIGWKKDKDFINSLKDNKLHNYIFLPMIMQSKSATDINVMVESLKDQQVALLDPLSVNQLLVAINEETLPQHDLLVVTGSLYLVGEFLDEWHKNNLS